MIEDSSALLSVRGLKVHFGHKSTPLRAVEDVSFSIGRGETLAIVGESGCGKTTTGMAVCGLQDITAGEVIFDGKTQQEIAALPAKERMQYRRRVQVVFQDPYSSLNPRMSLARTLEEPMRIHGATRAEARERADWLLGKVGLNPAHRGRYPHEFSGGQRQRIGIARALSLDPDLIICDEAVSALDVSVQAQIINLLMDLQDELGLSYLFISHDLAVVEHIADRVAVMYLGRVVEEAPWEQLFTNPRHPYTKALLSAIPRPDPNHQHSDRITLSGGMPNPMNTPSGCAFHPRCPQRDSQCQMYRPNLETYDKEHKIACHSVTQEQFGSLSA